MEIRAQIATRYRQPEMREMHDPSQKILVKRHNANWTMLH